METTTDRLYDHDPASLIGRQLDYPMQYRARQGTAFVLLALHVTVCPRCHHFPDWPLCRLGYELLRRLEIVRRARGEDFDEFRPLGRLKSFCPWEVC